MTIDEIFLGNRKVFAHPQAGLMYAYVLCVQTTAALARVK